MIFAITLPLIGRPREMRAETQQSNLVLFPIHSRKQWIDGWLIGILHVQISFSVCNCRIFILYKKPQNSTKSTFYNYSTIEYSTDVKLEIQQLQVYFYGKKGIEWFGAKTSAGRHRDGRLYLGRSGPRDSKNRKLLVSFCKKILLPYFLTQNKCQKRGDLDE